jgi:hypothetical protein
MNYDTFEKKKDEKIRLFNENETNEPEGELFIKNKHIGEKENHIGESSININENNNDKYNENEILNFDTFFMIRWFTVLAGITLISLNTIYGFVLPNNNINCIMDKIHDLTYDFNKFFNENVEARHALIIISSLCVDIISLFTSFNWACNGKSWRIIISIILFYGFRAFIQVIDKLLFFNLLYFIIFLFYFNIIRFLYFIDFF